MTEQNWEQYLDPGPDYAIDQETLRIHDIPDNSWHLNGKTLGQTYNGIRDSEKNTRFEEVLGNVGRFYCSRNVIALLAVSLALCAVTSVVSIEGFLFWNIVLFIIVWVKFELGARAQVRPEWQDVQEEIETL